MIGNAPFSEETLNTTGLKKAIGVFKMGKVNLDALIPREDFAVLEDKESKPLFGSSKFSVDANELKKDSVFYNCLRKPDFQRETDDWEPKKIVNLIRNFINGDLIPSLILWHGKGNYIFVIDGAHRLSALLAWINDDYGDGDVSKIFYNGNIAREHTRIAKKTRDLVKKEIGPYSHYQLAITKPNDVDPKIVEKHKLLAVRTFQLQWVQGDFNTAETSFLTINQQATPINKVETALIEGRRKSSCIAARAIRRSGTGHKYWLHFDDEKQNEIEELAKDINDLIFVPPYKRPIKSLEFPIAGNQNSGGALQLILNFVNITNDMMNKKQDEMEKDIDGTRTIEFLESCKRIIQKIRSQEAFSLGLHPAVYFYSIQGNYKPASFYAILALMQEFDKNQNLQRKFIQIRKDFEEFLLEYDQHIAQIVRKYREGIKSYTHVKEFYVEIIEQLAEKKSKDEVIKYLQEKGIKKDPKDFSTDAKSEVFMTEALKNPLRCKWCNGLIDSQSITIDHKQRKRDGGLGTPDNGQLFHPYCNIVDKN